MTQELIDVEEVSRLTGWQPGTIYKKRHLGQLPGAVKLGPRTLRFQRKAINNWLRERIAQTEMETR